MLTQLSTVKARLAILDTSYDDLLTSSIKAVSDRFDSQCNRHFARTVDATEEFPAEDTEILPASYPVETVTKFETKATEAEGWVEQTAPDFLIRRACVISLSSPINYQLSSISPSRALARVTYTGGYVMPGTAPGAGQTALPADIEQAAVEQVAFWFQKKDKLGIGTNWPSGGTYQLFRDQDLLQSLQAVLRKHQRITL